MDNAYFAKNTDNWRVLDRARRKVSNLEKMLLDYQEAEGETLVGLCGLRNETKRLKLYNEARQLKIASDGYLLQLNVAKMQYQNCMDYFMVHEVRLPHGNFIWELNT